MFFADPVSRQVLTRIAFGGARTTVCALVLLAPKHVNRPYSSLPGASGAGARAAPPSPPLSAVDAKRPAPAASASASASGSAAAGAVSGSAARAIAKADKLVADSQQLRWLERPHSFTPSAKPGSYSQPAVGPRSSEYARLMERTRYRRSGLSSRERARAAELKALAARTGISLADLSAQIGPLNHVNQRCVVFAAVCSDGWVRVFVYDPFLPNFPPQLVRALGHSVHRPTSAALVRVGGVDAIAVSGGDGHALSLVSLDLRLPSAYSNVELSERPVAVRPPNGVFAQHTVAVVHQNRRYTPPSVLPPEPQRRAHPALVVLPTTHSVVPHSLEEFEDDEVVESRHLTVSSQLLLASDSLQFTDLQHVTAPPKHDPNSQRSPYFQCDKKEVRYVLQDLNAAAAAKDAKADAKRQRQPPQQPLTLRAACALHDNWVAVGSERRAAGAVVQVCVLPSAGSAPDKPLRTISQLTLGRTHVMALAQAL